MSALMVITAKNPVHSVLFLIFSFFNAAGLFILLSAEYLAMLLVVVYVGAVAVLFLFVVMMLDIDLVAIREGFVKRLPLGVAVAVALFVQIGALVAASGASGIQVQPAQHVTPDATAVNNTKALGMILYTDYVYAFQVAGLILLVGMIGAIVLTHRRRDGVKRQVIARQVYRSRADSVEIVSVKSGEGV
jgi:NADH-quinone oxidoreductase subunit J